VINGNYQEDPHQAGAGAAQPVEEKEIGALEALWAFFSSMKTAIVLLLLLAATSIAGTIIEDRTGKTIYGSTGFSMLVLLIGINLAVCSINRFGLVWRTGFRPSAAASPALVSMMSRSQKVTCAGAVDSVADKVIRSLRSMHYRVDTEASDGAVSIYADKGRASVWGPHVTHLSLLIIFIGAIFGNYFGKEGFTNIVEGQRAAGYYPRDMKSKVKTPMGFEVGLNSFTITYDKNHSPVGYKSDLQVYDGGKATTRRTIDVNHPLTYNGLSFYQSDYGLVGLVMKVTAPDGQVQEIGYDISTDDTNQGRKYSVAGQPFKQFPLAGKNLTLFVHNLVPDYVEGMEGGRSTLPLNPAVNVMINDRFPQYKGMDAWGKLGWLTVSKSAEYKGYTVTLDRVVKYTGLQVSSNPALPVVYLGFVLAVLGVLLCFYVTHKSIRVSITGSGEAVNVVVGGTSKPDPAVMDKDLKRLSDSLA
jgi:cytochrome c biogenesis protein